MENILINKSLTVQNTILQHILSKTSGFSSEIQIKMYEQRSIHATDADVRQLNYILEIELNNKSNGKIIYFSFYDGYNGLKKLTHTINLALKAKEQKRTWINIKEYYNYLKIPYNFTNSFPQQGEEHLMKQLNFFLKKTEEFFNIPEIQKILNTDFWIDVPIDFSEYK